MENDKWNVVLIEWVNCLKLCKTVNNFDDLRNGEFFTNLQKVVSKTSSPQSDVLSFVFGLFDKYYPNFTIENGTEIHLNDLKIEDLKAMTSLLMHYTCIHDRKDVLTSPLCYSLSQPTQLIIRDFLQRLSNTKQISYNTLNSTINSCLKECPEATEQWLSDPHFRQSPLQDLLKTPMAKSGRLQEKDRLIAKLKTDLDAERFDKLELQETFNENVEKVKKLKQQLSQKCDENTRLRSEILALENRTPPHYQDTDSRELQRRLRSEIQSLELYIKQIDDEQEEIKKDRDQTKEALRKMELMCNSWEEKFFEGEKSLEVFKENYEKVKMELEELRVYCDEVTGMLEECKANPHQNDSALFESLNKDLEKVNNVVGDNLACAVVDVQLRDSQKMNDELNLKLEDLVKKLMTCEKNRDELEEKLANVVNEKGTLLVQLTEVQNQWESDKFDLKEMSLKVDELSLNLRYNCEKLTATKSFNEDLQIKLTFHESENEICKARIATLEQELESEKQNSKTLTNEREDLRILTEKLQLDLAEVLMNNQQLAEDYEDLKKNFDSVVENLNQSQIISRDLQTDLNNCQGIIAAMKIDMDHLHFENNNLKVDICASGVQITKIEKEKETIILEMEEIKVQSKKQIDDLQKNNLKLSNLLEISNNEANALRKTLNENIECEEKCNNLRTELEETIIKFNDANAKIDVGQSEMKKLEDVLKELQDELGQKEQDLLNCQRKSEKLLDENHGLSEEIAQKSVTLKMIENEKAILNEELMKLQENSSLNLENFERIEANLQNEISVFGTKVDELEGVIQTKEEIIREFEEAQEQLQEELSQKEDELKIIRETVEDLKNKNQSLSEEISKNLLALKVVENEKAILTEEFARLQQNYFMNMENSNKTEANFQSRISVFERKLNQIMVVIQTKEEVIKEFEIRQQHLQEELSRKNDELKENKETVDDLKNKNQSLSEESSNNLLALRTVENEKAILNEEFTKLQENYSMNKRNFEKIEANLQNEILVFVTKIDELVSVIQTKEEIIKEFEDNYRQLEEELGEKENYLKQNEEIIDDLKKENQNLSEEILQKSLALNVIEQEKQHLKEELDLSEKNCTQEIAKWKNLENLLNISEEEKNHLNEELDCLKKNYNELCVQHNNLKQSEEDLQKQVEEIEKKFSETVLFDQNQMQELQDSLKLVNEELNEKEEKIITLQEEILAKSEEIETAVEQKQLASAKIEELESDMRTIETKLSSKVEEIEDLEKGNEEQKRKHKQELSEFEDKCNILKNEVTNFKDLSETLKIKLEETVEQLLNSKTEAEKEEENLKEQLAGRNEELQAKKNDLKQLRTEKEAFEKIKQVNEAAIKSLEDTRKYLQDELKEKEDDLLKFQQTIEDYVMKNKSLTKDLTCKEEEMHKLKEELKCLKENYDEAKEKYNELCTQKQVLEKNEENLQTKVESLTELAESLKRFEDNSKTLNINLNEQLKITNEELQTKNNDLQHVREKIKKLTEENNSWKIKLQDSVRNFAKFEEKAKSDLDNLQFELTQTLDVLKDHKQESHDLRSSSENETIILNSLKTEFKQLQVKNEEILEENCDLRKQLQDQKNEIEKVHLEHYTTCANLQSVKLDFDRLEEENNDLELKIQELNTKTNIQKLEQELKTEINQLQEENKTLQKTLEEMKHFEQDLVKKDEKLAAFDKIEKQLNEVSTFSEMLKVECEDFRIRSQKSKFDLEEANRNNELLQQRLTEETLQKENIMEEKQKLELSLEDYEMTISGLKKVVDTNLENMELLKKELEEKKNNEESFVQTLKEICKNNNINCETEDININLHKLKSVLSLKNEENERTTLKENVKVQKENAPVSNKSLEEHQKQLMALKRKLVLTENSKNNLEKVIKELREEKKKSSDNDIHYKKLLQDFIQIKEENERLIKEKKDNEDKKNLQNLREAYSNVMALNSKLELEVVTLRKFIEEKNCEMDDVGHIKLAYERLLEENNKVMTEVDTLRYKRMKDKEEFVRLLKKERDESIGRGMDKVRDVRKEYEEKLEKMKEKMLKLYREEVNKKIKDGNSEAANLMRSVANLKSELFEANQKIQLLEMEREMVKGRQLRTISSTTSIMTNDSRASTLPRTSNIPTHNLQMEDEEDLFNEKFLTDLKEGRCAANDNKNSRFSELAWRNSMVPPHLKSSYPAETQFITPSRFKDDDIKSGNIEFDDSLCKLIPGEKQKKKDFGTTSYKKPGPPTPSKNGGRLSLQGNEIHPMKDHCEAKTPKKSTPSRIRALFAGRNISSKDTSEQSHGTPTRGRRLSIFRRPK